MTTTTTPNHLDRLVAQGFWEKDLDKALKRRATLRMKVERLARKAGRS